MKITHITAYEIIASGGYPTVEAKVTLEDGSAATASVPYGASAGSHEATVLVDNDTNRYNGKGVLKAINNITNTIAPKLIDMNALDQRGIDKTMIALDGTENKSKLGGNAILAVSLAVAKAAALSQKLPLYTYLIKTFQTAVRLTVETLPQPMMVVIEGGKHAHETTNLQEYCMTALQHISPKENVKKILESYHQLKKVLQEQNLSVNVGNEGAFAPNGIPTNESPFEYIVEAIQKAGYKDGKDIGMSIDAAASEFYKNERYNLSIENKKLTSKELSNYYTRWLEKYPIATLEDMHDEDDWKAWTEFKKICYSHNVPLIGDDLTVTNIKRLQKAIDENAISAILIKLNQIGSLTETIDCCMLAKKHNMDTITSHRGGGETNDTTMVDVAVAVGSSHIKVGPTRGERVSKYNRLMEIEREIGN